MQKLLLALLCMSVIATSVQAVNWALLVAGSNEYYNYRHQADVCHAYQIIKKNGIPDERIVVMMYDDIADSEQNPFKGTIINKPDGEDVYAGTLKDYTKKTVTPKNFLNVLQGKQSEMNGIGSGKVINSGPDDNIFVFFSDHGAPGIVAFPDGSALHASELNSALKNMHIAKKFKNMVLYIEACESGSMFENLLPENINIYATTASNAEESSYACYYDDVRQTYLGDLYSVNWMEDSDKGKMASETLDGQFEIVKALTNESHVMQYGDLTMNTMTVSQFQSENASPSKSQNSHKTPSKGRAVRTEDVRLSILQKRFEAEVDEAKRNKITEEIQQVKKSRSTVISRIHEIAIVASKNERSASRSMINSRKPLTNHECYVDSVNHLIEKCFTLKNEYVLRNLYVLVNLCESNLTSEQIKFAIDVVCPVPIPAY